MKIVKNEYKIVCDVKGCANMAEYRLIMDVGESDQLCMCSACLREFYREAAKSIRAEGKENAEKNDKRRNI